MEENIHVVGFRPEMSFTKKRIAITFYIPDGSLGPSGHSDELTISGYRIRATITGGTMLYGSQASLRIEGLPLATMNRLSVVQGMTSKDNQNTIRASNASVIVQAGDDEHGLSTIFRGIIAEAYADFAGAPDVAFQILAYDVGLAKTEIVSPVSYQGKVPVTTIFSDLAERFSRLANKDDGRPKISGIFVNHGLTSKTTITNFYKGGNLIDQIDELARAIGATYHFDTNGNLHVWAASRSVNKDATTVTISKHTGLIGYPSYNQQGIHFTTLFKPTIQFNVPVKIDSTYLPAGWVNNQMGQSITPMPVNGLWNPTFITHDLSCETPNGPWFTYVTAQRTDYALNQVAQEYKS
ncbi:baseplate hub protein [Swingsia samuiensis]|uniref:Uncharacterized protein n=1 Tax=Swingsia samuiensis TaxID=1293412 RepID=A0A4Y6UL80_9PROT|nr:hypothetical protein [Swingsia samuiensis]QDH17398.1 hypothetical protein E3D00_07345 [Swingsia samuiensis]